MFKKQLRGGGKSFSLGAQACTHSHYSALERFRKSKRFACLILEDDVELSPSIVNMLNESSWSYPGHGVISLEVTWPGSYMQGLPVGRTSCGREISESLGGIGGSGAYLVSQDGASIILKSKSKLAMPMDRLLYEVRSSPTARRLAPLQVNPGFARQIVTDKDSDIAPTVKSPDFARFYRKRLSNRITRIPYQIRCLRMKMLGETQRVRLFFQY